MQRDDVESQRPGGTPSIMASCQGILDIIPVATYTWNPAGLITWMAIALIEGVAYHGREILIECRERT